MARRDQPHGGNVDGAWFVDTRCVRCDAARHWAPGLIEMDEQGQSYLARQPSSAEEEAALWRASVACPTRSIGNREMHLPPHPAFPFELTPGVLALGHNAASSFGAHSYLVPRPEGNVMIDSPRFTRSLAKAVDELGGISHVVLSHRDDVADADRWAAYYDARVWIHEAEVAAAPYATDVFVCDDVWTISPGVVVVLVPGHTEGHVVVYIDDRWLFTGDTLMWNHRRVALDVTPGQTFYSWAELAASMDRLAGLRVEWVFPGHGKWHHIGFDAYAEEMKALGPAMREIGRNGWAQRPDSAFNWY